LYIHPGECIDCNACVPECPVEAIFPEAEVPAQWRNYTQMNAEKAPTATQITHKKEALAGKTAKDCSKK